MTPHDLVTYYKTRVKAAAEIGVTEQTIKNWVVSNNIPRLAQLAIQTLTKNKLKADGE